MKIILSCEHGGNRIPSAYASLFKGHEQILHSHQGFDPGTMDLFEYLKSHTYFSKSNDISRLLIECNRSLHHPKLFSEISKTLNSEEKKQLVNQVYIPYRNAIEQEVENMLHTEEMVVHLSLHSFTPIYNAEIRNNDLGLLYDPKRTEEREFCKEFKLKLLQKEARYKVRMNYPYLGNADGFTTYLRSKFKKNYLGIEIEINQRHVTSNKFPLSLKENLLEIIQGL